jgi:endonuclease/exonuclease/phosphatase (EEP) superfamily protein YafD
MADAITTWLLPLHLAWVIVVGIFGFLMAAIISIALACNGSKWWWGVAVLQGSLTIFSFCWLLYSNAQTPQVYRTVDYTVKIVMFPDGKQIQMFHVDGENKNANMMFSCQVPEGQVVRRYIFKRVYCGIYYPVQNNERNTSNIKDVYAIVDPLTNAAIELKESD